MPEINCSGWFPTDGCCFVISNTDADKSSRVTAQSFINPPIKLILPEGYSDKELRMFFHCEYSQTHPFLKNLPIYLRAKLNDWRLIGADIDANPGSIALYYATNNPTMVDECRRIGDDGKNVDGNCDPDFASIQIIYSSMRFPETLEFMVDLADGLPPYRYVMSTDYVNGLGDYQNNKVPISRVSKYIGDRKLYDLEMREDNHGQETNDWRQYYTGKLYL